MRVRVLSTEFALNWRVNMTAEGEELPTAEDEDYQKVHTRSRCSYESHCKRFRHEKREYTTQYAHIYFSRLFLMRSKLETAASKKWGTY